MCYTHLTFIFNNWTKLLKTGQPMAYFMVPLFCMLLISYGFTVVSPFGYNLIPVSHINTKPLDFENSAIYLFMVEKSCH